MISDMLPVYVDLEATDDVVRGLQRVSDGVVTLEVPRAEMELAWPATDSTVAGD